MKAEILSDAVHIPFPCLFPLLFYPFFKGVLLGNLLLFFCSLVLLAFSSLFYFIFNFFKGKEGGNVELKFFFFLF